ncbi:MAG TPA: autotransporter-associated beta strand repeat-containing protein, partial [Candidatus Dormibacteraeota bacterium]|nr:autotransporter-associated beta strand repeat-containing protein [Candidatus Dormibacteraeota bacterium]
MNHKTVSSVSTRQFRRIASLASCALLLHVAPLPAQDIWNGSAATTNWSSAGNWSFGVIPGTADTVEFDNIIPGAASGVVDNIVDTGFTIGSLIYQTASTNGFHTTSIPLSLSLNINGNGLGNPAGNIVYVGTGVPANTESITYRVVGPGTLSITNTNGVISIVQGGANNDHFATLDLTGLTNFSCSVTQMFVGCIADTATFGVRPMGIMRLAETNYIQTAAGVNSPGIMVACYPTSDTSLRGTEQLFFGRHNVISSDAISVGGTKTTGSINSRPGVPSAFASLRGSAGGSDKVKLLTIGDGRAGMFNYVAAGTTVASSGTFDASGTFLDALVQDLYVARSQTNNNGATTGILTFDQGSITADNVYVGFHPAPAATSGTFNGTGTINVNGNATLNVNNDLLLTRKLGPTVPVATLNISSNGTVNVKGNVVTSNGTSTITFNGGLLNMQPAGDATPGNVTVGALAGNGTITNAANVTNSASLTPGTSSTAGTLSIYGNFMLSNNAPVNFNLTNVTTVGSGLNDYVSVAGNVTLNSNNLVLTPVSSTLAGGTYRVMDYTGARNGFLNFTNQTRYSLGLGYPAGQINLTNSGGAPASLRWAGTSSALWDLATSNWFNTGSSASDRFFAYDTTLVDDSGAYTNLLLVNTTLYPGSVTVSSSTRDYSFGGSGKISGGASLTKQGSSTLTISNANDFSGPAVISAGTLKTANGSALGSTNSGTTIASGATLDLFGASLFSPGEAVTVSGTGVGGNGAIINSGADQQNGLRFITLAGDTAVSSSSPGRWDLRGPGGAGSFNAALNLNGFTMTKLGAGKQSLVDSTITNAGSIIISNGILGLTRSLIDGPGTITSIGTNFVQIENSSTGYIAKPMTFNGGGGTLQVVGNAFTLFSSVTNNGGLTIDSQVGLTLTNIISGPGSLAKISAGTLTLQAPDLGTGPTT